MVSFSPSRWFVAGALTLLTAFLHELPEFEDLQLLTIVVSPMAVAAAALAFLPREPLPERSLAGRVFVLTVAGVLLIVPLLLGGFLLFPFFFVPFLAPVIVLLGLAYLARFLALGPVVFLDGPRLLDAPIDTFRRTRGTGLVGAMLLLLLLGFQFLLDLVLGGSIVLQVLLLDIPMTFALGGLGAWSYRNGSPYEQDEGDAEDAADEDDENDTEPVSLPLGAPGL